MSTAGTVTGKGFVISYSVQSNPSGSSTYPRSGGYTVTIDNTDVATCSASNTSNNNQSKSDTHIFFTSKIALAFTIGTNSGNSGTAMGSGSMKYILGS
jgi:hypothetical protein